jgi:DNA-directed RNA polymerase subunit RPC12/RpoP
MREDVIKLDLSENLKCPRCSNNHFSIERTVTYVYSYKFDADNIEYVTDKTEALPFLFDNREKTDSVEYIKCEACGSKYPVSLDEYDKKINMTILEKAIRSDFINNPQYLG